MVGVKEQDVPVKLPPSPEEIKKIIEELGVKFGSPMPITEDKAGAVDKFGRITIQKNDPEGLGMAILSFPFDDKATESRITGLLYMNDHGVKFHMFNVKPSERFEQIRDNAYHSSVRLITDDYIYVFGVSKEAKVDGKWKDLELKSDNPLPQ